MLMTVDAHKIIMRLVMEARKKGIGHYEMTKAAYPHWSDDEIEVCRICFARNGGCVKPVTRVNKVSELCDMFRLDIDYVIGGERDGKIKTYPVLWDKGVPPKKRSKIIFTTEITCSMIKL